MKIMSLAMAAGLSVAMAASSMVPAQALQIAPPKVEKQATNDVVQVAHRKWRQGKRWRGGHRWNNRRAYWRGRYNHRRHWRGGYYRSGVWIGGPRIVIGVNPRPRWNRHVRWCRNNYVTYRRSDNTFVANSGVRRVCVSPYRR
ncbi:BA14K family protein [Rhizobium sp.]